MGFKVFKIFFVFVLFSFFTACGKDIDKSLFKEGDIIFQNKKSKASDFTALLSDAKYNNLGVLYSIGDKWYVFEASQPAELTPLNAWVKEGEKSHYAVKRLKEEETVMTKEALGKMEQTIKEFMGKPYDFKYDWSDKALYGSELVWKIFYNALNIELCPLQTLADFDLTKETIKNKTKEVYGSKVPLYEELVTPAAIYASPLLIAIVEN
ncbi:MAG: peptidoglycan peptidase [Endomicrobia bacterium]|nr:peptidoglycan peptidase [Endomicrobiia bacterium]MCL2799667.1 peptidoglycan peptidase [Endomicrobiia bacterium]